jgi:general stress protein 26
MTWEERLKAVQEMDAVIERAEHAMMATLAQARAIHRRLMAKKAELEKQLAQE